VKDVLATATRLASGPSSRASFLSDSGRFCLDRLEVFERAKLKENVLHPYVTSYRRMIAAFNAGDLEAVREVVSSEIVYTVPGKSPLAGRTTGLADHVEMLKKARQMSEGSLTLTPGAVAQDGEHLFVWGTIRAQRGERRLDAKHCVVFRFDSGKIVEGWTVPTDLYAFDDFWSGP
jgi:ketosteroid isomerase-like protein